MLKMPAPLFAGLPARLLALSLLGLALSGCNTIEGAGKDVKAAGGAIEKAAEKSKSY